MNKPHVHKDIIIAYANGFTIQFKIHDGSFEGVDNPSFYSDDEYRIKPEREWPVTSLTEMELEDIYNKQEGADFIGIANAAIKQYIIDSEK